MIRSLLLRGMLVGLAGGLLAFGVARVLGEPQVNKAIAFEEYVEYNVHHEAAEDGPVSRAVQDSGGLGAGAILYGVAFGGLFALVFAAAYGRLGTMTARAPRRCSACSASSACTSSRSSSTRPTHPRSVTRTPSGDGRRCSS